MSIEKISFRRLFAKQKPLNFEGLNLVVCNACKEIECKCSSSNSSSENNNYMKVLMG